MATWVLGWTTMRHVLTVAVALVLVLSLVGLAGVAIANNDENDESPDAVAPGERMSGVLGVQDAEVEGEIAERGFGIAVANAATEDAQADVVADRLAIVEERLDDHEDRLAELEEQRAAGEIREGQYRAKVAQLEAERASTERLATQAAVVAQDLPTALLEERGISVEHIEELRERAHELTGPEVAAIAQEIAGPQVAEQLPDAADDRIPAEAGPPGEVGPDDDRPGAADDDRPGVADDDEPTDEDEAGQSGDDVPALTTGQ